MVNQPEERPPDPLLRQPMTAPVAIGATDLQLPGRRRDIGRNHRVVRHHRRQQLVGGHVHHDPIDPHRQAPLHDEQQVLQGERAAQAEVEDLHGVAAIGQLALGAQREEVRLLDLQCFREGIAGNGDPQRAGHR